MQRAKDIADGLSIPSKSYESQSDYQGRSVDKAA
jgi:hypothetical protein